MPNIDPELVRKHFAYDTETGELRWRIGSRRVKVGDVAGHAVSAEDGRIKVGFLYKTVWAHQLIWAYQTGEWPTHFIDHINRNPSDNRWCNLRAATHVENRANQTKTNNKYGYRGLYWIKHTSKWGARVTVNNKTHHIGCYETKEKAHEAFKDAHRRLHGKFSPYHQNFPSGA